MRQLALVAQKVVMALQPKLAQQARLPVAARMARDVMTMTAPVDGNQRPSSERERRTSSCLREGERASDREALKCRKKKEGLD